MRHPALLAVLAAAILAGCESSDFKKLRQEKEALKVEYDRVLKQMEEVWQASLKARFPLLRDFEPGKPQELALRYIKTLQLEPAPHHTDRWQAQVTYFSREKVHPKYVIYLFDRRGLNVGKRIVDPREKLVLKKQLDAGVQTSVTEPIEVDVLASEPPRYFWIHFLE